jgi:hypothetical protein
MQYTLNIEDGSGHDVRLALTNALKTLATCHAGPSAPAETYPGMIWFDTTAGGYKQRNAGDTDWAPLSFALIPLLPASDPTTDNQAVRRKFVTDIQTALNAAMVHLTGDETVAGKKTFSTVPASSQDPGADNDLCRRSYLLGQISGKQAQIQYVLIRDEKSSGTDGGGFSQGAWRTRDLNSEVIDTGSLASLAGNQITLAAGTYRFRAHAPAYMVAAHQLRLQNITAGTTVAYGSSEKSNTTISMTTRSFIEGQFTLAAPAVLELQHRCDNNQPNNGFGLSCGFGNTEVYSVIEFWKMA